MIHIGLLGGSFDPPHRGHLYISLEAKKILKLNELWWIVSPKNPLKKFKPVSYEDRLEDCYKIVKNYPIKIKEVEKKINSKYTFETVKYLKSHYPNIKFYWLMGADNLINFHKWQEWRNIFFEISIVIFRRHRYNSLALNSLAKKTFSNYQINSNDLHQLDFNNLPSWTFIKYKEIRISSTEIRAQRKILRGL